MVVGSKHFLLHGSFNDRLFQRFWLAVEEFLPIRKWLKKLPWREKPRLPCEGAWKARSETGVKSDLAFCLGSLFKKTNSAVLKSVSHKYAELIIPVFQKRHVFNVSSFMKQSLNNLPSTIYVIYGLNLKLWYKKSVREGDVGSKNHAIVFSLS